MYKKYLERLYGKYDIITEDFETDYEYLKNSISAINKLWNNNFDEIDKVNLIILAEAPMWGDDKKYFYNPETYHSQFFFKSDIEDIIQETITSKTDLIASLNNVGIVILDFSPFSFNPKKTKLSYTCDDKGWSKKIRKSDYKEILIETYSEHLKTRLNKISKKSGNVGSINICYRYGRVKKNLHSALKSLFLKEGFQKIGRAVSISKNGGGIDRTKLKHEITQSNKNTL